MKRALSIVLCMTLAFPLLVSCTKPGIVKPEKTLTAVELSNLGEKYLLEMDYEKAVVYFTRVIEIEPMNVRAYLGLADAYIGKGDIEKAIEILNKGYEITTSETLKVKLEELTNAEKVEMTLEKIAELEPWRLFDHILRVEDLTIGGIPFYKHSPDPEWELHQKYGVQLSVRDEETFAFVGSNEFNEFADLSLGIGLDDALSKAGFSEEGVALIRNKKNETPNIGILFNIYGMNHDNTSVHTFSDLSYDPLIIIYYYRQAEEDSLISLVMGFYNETLRLLEVHAVKD
ncbi:Prokaryotic membrane lipoprotein lipid attachment site profile [Desulfitobacterium hafniense]|uniref:Prokaryotic membrane lipoprotein lipid attachment site profile n=1 Tax=Desulfitobacterium hafniense TaxID=49338 RepID=A0A098BAN8_DESHA|nr:tetratricopeptide repeat protein [Desulfitobacterium hafniense]CDX04946.1 Prokaryotic membrane lipoprotein lipid attachment site profile [Desulfitobacterium hafniense]